MNSPDQTTQPVERGSVPQFDIGIRGYDRRQVDERLAYLTAELRAAEAALRRADHNEAELRQLRQQLAVRNESTFGFRVEKILRLAEEEANEVREQATAEVQAHRAAVEQELAERSAAIERQERELADRHASIERQLQTMRAQAEHDAVAVRAAAEQQAAALFEHARAKADQLRADTERELDRRRGELERQIDDLAKVRDRLAEQLRQAQAAIGEVIGKHLAEHPVS